MHRHQLPAVAAGALLALGAFSCTEDKLITINQITDTFTQGAGTQATLSFRQKSALVDVLFVVDNSPSMCEKQRALSQKFQSFIGTLQSEGLDFHIGVTTTDFVNVYFQGKLVAASGNPAVLTPATPNLAQVFSQNVAAVGLSGTPRSQGLMAALAAVTEPLIGGANVGFLRADASLAIILVSDEEDLSLAVPPADPAEDYFVGFFTRSFDLLKGPGNDNLVTVSAIIGADAQGSSAECQGGGTHTAACAAYSDLDGHTAPRAASVARATGGLVQSICASDFGPLLSTIAEHIGGLTWRYDLTGVPLGQSLDPATITIGVTMASGDSYTIPPSDTDGWSYDDASLSLGFHGTGLPPPNSQVTIRYATLTRAFKLTDVPVAASIAVTVTVDGKTAPVSATTDDPRRGWTFDPPTNSVVFGADDIPPLKAVVDVTYTY